jgi:putative Mn2+ efflux pump MntP
VLAGEPIARAPHRAHAALVGEPLQLEPIRDHSVAGHAPLCHLRPVLEVVTLSIALAMDATAVAAARGLAAGRVPPRDALLLPALFGGFQSGMAALGWLAGRWIGPSIARWDTWIAFALLSLLGVKMIVEAVRGGDEPESPADDLLTLLGLALATSIDAAAAGVTLPILSAPPAISLVLIGAVTAVLSAVGLYVGRLAGRRFGSGLEALGGVALIAIGAKLLIDHLW